MRRRLFNPRLSWLFTIFKNKARLGSSPLVFDDFRVAEVSRKPGILRYSGASTLSFLAQLLSLTLWLFLRFGRDESRSKTIWQAGNAAFNCSYPFSVTIV